MDQRSASDTVADPSFFGSKYPQGGGFTDEPVAFGSGGDGADESRVSMEFDSVKGNGGVDVCVSAQGEVDGSGSSKDEGSVMEMVGDRVPGSSGRELVPAAVDAGVELRASDGQEFRVFEGDRVLYDARAPDVVRVHDKGNWMKGFELGDMVWGKVKSHPWWPGYIFNEAFASASVRRSKSKGHVLVAFFGDSSYGWFEPEELSPFDSHFLENSKQTTVKNFVDAVEDALDETRRRVAVGLTCRCRNPLNFHPTHVPGHFYVDLPGFDSWLIYSSTQVNSARDRFVPEDALSFVQQMALEPLTIESPCIDWIKGTAMMTAYRRAKFEEFDETYAQAFGVQPVRPPRNKGAPPDHHEKFAPRAKFLSGQLVIPEPQHHRKISSKNNKYVHQERDEPQSSESIFDGSLKSLMPKQPQQLYSSVQLAIAPSNPCKDNHYVCEQQQQPLPAVTEHSKSVHGDVKVVQHNFLASYEEKSLKQPTPTGHGRRVKKLEELNGHIKLGSVPKAIVDHFKEKPGPAEVEQHKVSAAIVIDAAVKKVKAWKRPLEDDGSSSKRNDTLSINKKMKKKRKNEAVHSVFYKVLRDLLDLAANPLNGVGRHSTAVLLNVFAKYRSLVRVYKRTPVLPSSSQVDDQKLQAKNQLALGAQPETDTGKAAVGDQRGPLPSILKPSKFFLKSDDPVKAGSKRIPSEQLEEWSSKRLKEVDIKLKALASAKVDDGGQMAAKELKTGTASEPKRKTAESGQKKEPLPNSKVAEHSRKQEKPLALPSTPTTLVMKFPPGSSLPSVTFLKAKFARFGPMDHSATRVFWKSYTCKVVFKFKSDAQAALQYVNQNDFFDQGKVWFTLRDVEPPSSDPSSTLGKKLPEAQTSEGPRFNDGVSFNQQPRPLKQQSEQPFTGELKSILKKPGHGSGTNRNARESQRVKFILDGGDGKIEQPPAVVAANEHINGEKPSSSLPIIDSTASKNTKPVTSISSLPPLSRPIRGLASVRLSPLSSPTLPSLTPLPLSIPSPKPKGCDYVNAKGGKEVAVDISEQMLSLMTRCSDIVRNLESSFGYLPLHPL